MLNLSQIARILVQHGIPAHCPDLADFVAAHVTAQGCRVSTLRNWLGY